MKINTASLRRKQLDRQLMPVREAVPAIRPKDGWIRAIRESLGMSLETFGKRLGVTRATAHQIEKAEQSESITIKRLRAAADALECDLIISIVPRNSLDGLIREKAYQVARKDAARVNHTMLLEGQALYDKDHDDFVDHIAQDLIDRNDPRIWTSK